MLGLRTLDFAICRHGTTGTQFVIKKVALGWPDLWIFSLHLNLLLKLWRNLSRWCIYTCCVAILTTRRAVPHTVDLWLLHIIGGPVVRARRLREEVVLVGGRLQVLVSRSLHVLCPWNLYLDIWAICSLFS